MLTMQYQRMKYETDDYYENKCMREGLSLERNKWTDARTGVLFYQRNTISMNIKKINGQFPYEGIHILEIYRSADLYVCF